MRQEDVLHHYGNTNLINESNNIGDTLICILGIEALDR